jgi:hypothetical protein
LLVLILKLKTLHEEGNNAQNLMNIYSLADLLVL